MKGVVKMTNPKRGLIAVEIDTNDLTVMEILEVTCNVEIGDIISGNLDSHAGETVTNLTKNEKISVFIEGINCTPQNAHNLMK